jgi:hypothetical protein
LIQKIFESIRKAGPTGMHLARGERSMLDAFQSAAKTVSINEVGVLVPLFENVTFRLELRFEVALHFRQLCQQAGLDHFIDVGAGEREWRVESTARRATVVAQGNEESASSILDDGCESRLEVALIARPHTLELSYDKGKGILDSTTEGGCVLVRLGNDESLGRELRAYLQTEKYLSHKNDGTLSESTKRILRDCADDNRERRERLTALFGEMLAAAEYFVAGQPLKLKASTPWAALDEAMEYLIQNTFNKMSYLKRHSAEPLKEVQAVLRSNDIAKEQQLFQTGENNPEALEDLRSYLQLCSMKSQQVVLHDMLEKRYSLRPYGWPDDEVLLLLARLIVLSEINLMMDSTLLPVDKVYEAIATPAKRRKVVIRKREISDPKTIQNARSLGKDLFAEMGPDGEDGLTTFLQTKLKGWQAALHGYKQLAETGNYPGGGAITQGLMLINPLLADKESRKFIERFNTLKKDLLDLADRFHDLEHFYVHQKPIWEKLRKAHAAFQLNRLELEKNPQANPALKRIQEIFWPDRERRRSPAP